MTHILLLTLSIFLVLGNFGDSAGANTTPNQNTAKFDVKNLSERGQIAYKKLVAATQFEDTHIGYAGSLSQYVVEFGLLLKEKKSDAAFKSLLKNGTTAGKLYGLSGIYFTDYEIFQIEAAKMSKSKKTVMKMSGCIVYDEKVSEIVKSSRKNVAIINPGTTIEDFWKSNRKSYHIDILNGGYPATFVHAAKKSK